MKKGKNYFKINVIKMQHLANLQKLDINMMAKILNVSRSTYYRVMNNEIHPGSEFLVGFIIAFPDENFLEYFKPCSIDKHIK